MSNDLHVMADGAGLGITKGPHDEFAPSFVFTCPVGDPVMPRTAVITVTVPRFDQIGLRRFAKVAETMADAMDMHLDHDQASEFLSPILNAPLDGLAPDAVVQVVDSENTAEAAEQVREAHDHPPPVPHGLCTVCGRRIYGDLIERGACLACAPTLPEGERHLNAVADPEAE